MSNFEISYTIYKDANMVNHLNNGQICRQTVQATTISQATDMVRNMNGGLNVAVHNVQNLSKF